MKNIRYTIWFLFAVILTLLYCEDLKSEENTLLSQQTTQAERRKQ